VIAGDSAKVIRAILWKAEENLGTFKVNVAIMVTWIEICSFSRRKKSDFKP